MSDLLDENLLSFLKDEYKIIKSSPRCGISYILVIENKLSTEHEVLKVIDVRDVPKEKIQEYLSALEVVNKINDEHNYLVKYSMIKEENGYIYLKMREFIGSLDVEDINIYPIYENMMSKDYKEKTEEEEEEEDHRIVCGYVREEEDDDEDDDENNHKKKKSQKKKKNEPKKIEYKCRKGSYRYNAYYDICYSVYLLHSNNLIHGNISKKNIFYYNKHFYLSDYCQYLLHDVDITEKVDDDKNEKQEEKDDKMEAENENHENEKVEENNETDDEEKEDESNEKEEKSDRDDDEDDEDDDQSDGEDEEGNEEDKHHYISIKETVRSRKVYVGDKNEDICSLGYIQEHLSKIVTDICCVNRDEEIDEDSRPEEAVDQLYQNTKECEYDIEEILERLDDLKLKKWDNPCQHDYETYSCTNDELDSVRTQNKLLRRKISRLRTKMFALEKEKEKQAERITELEKEVETLSKGNNERSVKRKKLTINQD